MYYQAPYSPRKAVKLGQDRDFSTSSQQLMKKIARETVTNIEEVARQTVNLESVKKDLQDLKFDNECAVNQEVEDMENELSNKYKFLKELFAAEKKQLEKEGRAKHDQITKAIEQERGRQHTFREALINRNHDQKQQKEGFEKIHFRYDEEQQEFESKNIEKDIHIPWFEKNNLNYEQELEIIAQEHSLSQKVTYLKEIEAKLAQERIFRNEALEFLKKIAHIDVQIKPEGFVVVPIDKAGALELLQRRSRQISEND